MKRTWGRTAVIYERHLIILGDFIFIDNHNFLFEVQSSISTRVDKCVLKWSCNSPEAIL